MRIIGIHGEYMTGMMSVVALSFGGGGGGGKGYFSPGDVCVMNEGILRFEWEEGGLENWLFMDGLHCFGLSELSSFFGVAADSFMLETIQMSADRI